MNNHDAKDKTLRRLAAALCLGGCLAVSGCQVHVAGQTLPSPYWLSDDLQYYAPGPEFKLTNEAAALQAQAAEAVSTPQADP